MVTMRAFPALAVLTVVACADSPVTAPEVTPQARYSQDVHWAQLAARDIPGFGGLYLDESGKTVVLMAETHAQNAVSQEAAKAFGTSVRAQLKLPTGSSDVRIRLVKYDFAQLSGWYEQLSTRIADLPDVYWSDIDEVENRIHLGVRRGAAVGALVNAALGVGIPRDAISFEESLPPAPRVNLTNAVRAVDGGVKIVGNGICTLGVNALVGAAGTRGFITASHCSTSWYAPDVGAFRQPSSVIGHEAYDYAGTSGYRYLSAAGVSRICNLPCRWSDSQISLYVDRNLSSSVRRLAIDN